MGVSDFHSGQEITQLNMFDEPQEEAKIVDKLADDINRRFGHKLLSRARGIRRPD